MLCKHCVFKLCIFLCLSCVEVLKKVVDEIEERKNQQNKLFAVVHIGKSCGGKL